MHIRICVPLLSLLYTLTACGSDPKAPNEANFRAAINAVLAKRNPYCDTFLSGGPMGIYPADGPQGRAPNALTAALVKHGLLVPNGTTRWFVSPEGLKLTPSDQRPSQISFAACTADGAEVAKIDNWTEPSAMIGITITKVSYTMKPTKIAAWLTPDIAPLIPTKTPKESDLQTMTLILTAKGWAKAE